MRYNVITMSQFVSNMPIFRYLWAYILFLFIMLYLYIYSFY